jgi:hypothetical protein
MELRIRDTHISYLLCNLGQEKIVKIVNLMMASCAAAVDSECESTFWFPFIINCSLSSHIFHTKRVSRLDTLGVYIYN